MACVRLSRLLVAAGLIACVTAVYDDGKGTPNRGVRGRAASIAALINAALFGTGQELSHIKHTPSTTSGPGGFKFSIPAQRAQPTQRVRIPVNTPVRTARPEQTASLRRKTPDAENRPRPSLPLKVRASATPSPSKSAKPSPSPSSSPEATQSAKASPSSSPSFSTTPSPSFVPNSSPGSSVSPGPVSQAPSLYPTTAVEGKSTDPSASSTRSDTISHVEPSTMQSVAASPSGSLFGAIPVASSAAPSPKAFRGRSDISSASQIGEKRLRYDHDLSDQQPDSSSENNSATPSLPFREDPSPLVIVSPTPSVSTDGRQRKPAQINPDHVLIEPSHFASSATGKESFRPQNGRPLTKTKLPKKLNLPSVPSHENHSGPKQKANLRKPESKEEEKNEKIASHRKIAIPAAPAVPSFSSKLDKLPKRSASKVEGEQLTKQANKNVPIIKGHGHKQTAKKIASRHFQSRSIENEGNDSQKGKNQISLHPSLPGHPRFGQQRGSAVKTSEAAKLKKAKRTLRPKSNPRPARASLRPTPRKTVNLRPRKTPKPVKPGFSKPIPVPRQRGDVHYPKKNDLSKSKPGRNDASKRMGGTKIGHTRKMATRRTPPAPRNPRRREGDFYKNKRHSERKTRRDLKRKLSKYQNDKGPRRYRQRGQKRRQQQKKNIVNGPKGGAQNGVKIKPKRKLKLPMKNYKAKAMRNTKNRRSVPLNLKVPKTVKENKKQSSARKDKQYRKKWPPKIKDIHQTSKAKGGSPPKTPKRTKDFANQKKTIRNGQKRLKSKKRLDPSRITKPRKQKAQVPAQNHGQDIFEAMEQILELGLDAFGLGKTTQFNGEHELSTENSWEPEDTPVPEYSIEPEGSPEVSLEPIESGMATVDDDIEYLVTSSSKQHTVLSDIEAQRRKILQLVETIMNLKQNGSLPEEYPEPTTEDHLFSSDFELDEFVLNSSEPEFGTVSPDAVLSVLENVYNGIMRAGGVAPDGISTSDDEAFEKSGGPRVVDHQGRSTGHSDELNNSAIVTSLDSALTNAINTKKASGEDSSQTSQRLRYLIQELENVLAESVSSDELQPSRAPLDEVDPSGEPFLDSDSVTKDTELTNSESEAATRSTQKKYSASLQLSVSHPSGVGATSVYNAIRVASADFLGIEKRKIIVEDVQFSEREASSSAIVFHFTMKLSCSSTDICVEMHRKVESFVKSKDLDKTLAEGNFSDTFVTLHSLKPSKDNGPSNKSGDPNSVPVRLSTLHIGLLALAGVAAFCAIVIVGALVYRQTRGKSEVRPKGSLSRRGLSLPRMFSNAQSREGESFMVSNFGGHSRSSSDVSPWMADLYPNGVHSQLSVFSPPRTIGGGTETFTQNASSLVLRGGLNDSDLERGTSDVIMQTQRDSYVRRDVD